jgi:hypothetical protein
MRLISLTFFLTVSITAAADSVYSHPSGLHFQYPAGWSIKDSSFADFELVPSDVGSNELGTVETYFQWGFLFESSEQKIAEKLETLIPRVVPFLNRTGQVERFSAGQTEGMILNWNGKDPSGLEVWSRVFVVPEKELTIALVALGEKKRIDGRENEIRSILSSYRFDPGDRDQTLLGEWGSTAQEPCSKGDKTGTSEIKSSLELQSAGDFQMSESARFTGCGEDANGSKDDYDEAFNGIWFAKEGKLYLVSSSNTSMTLHYQIQGEPGSRTLTLDHGTGRSQILSEKHP